MEKRNNLPLLALMVFILSLIILFSILYVRSIILLEEKEAPIILQIGETAGFDVNSTAISFGRVPPGSSSLRRINISNDYGFPIKAVFTFEGDVKEFVHPVPIQYLEPGEQRQLGITTLNIPKNAEFGNYTGVMTVIFKRDVL